MGCNQSKDNDKLAVEFFGNEESAIDLKPATATSPPSESFAVTARTGNSSGNKEIQGDFPVQKQQPKLKAKKRGGPAVRPREMTGHKSRKSASEFVAPPSSDMFVDTTPSRILSPLLSQSHAAQAEELLSPDVDVNVNAKTSKPKKLDDDDFSVAPSLGVAMRSIVAVDFDNIYSRGKKVSLSL
jgi:hypothetical protein